MTAEWEPCFRQRDFSRESYRRHGNVTHTDEIKNIHKQYISAGSDIVLANTFGANALKFHCDDFPLEEIIRLAIGHVKDAAEEASDGRRIYTALDVEQTGKLLKPMGDLDFETAYRDIQRSYDPRRESRCGSDPY